MIRSASAPQPPLVLPFEELRLEHVPEVGGKNASLGELIHALEPQGLRIPGGFATTAHAYRRFLEDNGLEAPVAEQLRLWRSGRPLPEVGKAIRELILSSPIPADLEEAVRGAYRALSRRYDRDDLDVAVRSSATAEDLPEASFAGQQDSFLNVVGADELMDACRRCFASLFTDRAMGYREERGFDHLRVALSVGIQKMVRSDVGAAGVLFTLDPDTGFPRVMAISSSWGLGESVVKGTVTPDQFTLFKPLLSAWEYGDNGAIRRPEAAHNPVLDRERGSKEEKIVYSSKAPGGTVTVATTQEEREAFSIPDETVLTLARWGVLMEKHYGYPLDVEWALDGVDGELYIVQARPETVQTRVTATGLRTYTLRERGEVRVEGTAVGDAIAHGTVCRIESPAEIHRFRPGSILVTRRTDPDWGPILNAAGGVVTDQGGRTSHAAIVSRELGIPAVVGSGNAMEILEDGEEVTLSCAEGDRGFVYSGTLAFDTEEQELEGLPETRTRIMMNLGNPAAAFRWWRLPARGIGLARVEFIISEIIKAHPMALLHPDRLSEDERDDMAKLTRGHADGAEYFVDLLSRGVGKLAALAYPEPVVVRLSDFKSNEYAGLLGGSHFEPVEENPMLGFRGACRYYSPRYREGFALECRALKRVREDMGFQNVIIMVPFCRTLEEADRVLEVMAENGLVRGDQDLKVYVMCEVPSNVLLAQEFGRRFDGFSIGSNDLTQLALGVDRDSGDPELAAIFDERDPAVLKLIQQVIQDAHGVGVPVGICGQAPSDHAGFAELLVAQGIDSISLNPDSVPAAIRRVAEAEAAERGRVEGPTR